MSYQDTPIAKSMRLSAHIKDRIRVFIPILSFSLIAAFH